MSELRLQRTRLAYRNPPVAPNVTVVYDGKHNDDAIKAWSKKLAEEEAPPVRPARRHICPTCDRDVTGLLHACPGRQRRGRP